jgi:hypothetical protein
VKIYTEYIDRLKEKTNKNINNNSHYNNEVMHGSRDFYSLIKFLCQEKQISDEIIIKGFRRNFGGNPL